MRVRAPGIAVRVLLGAGLSLGLLVLLLHQASPGRVLQALGRARPAGVAAVLLAHLGSLALRILRWRTLLRGSGSLRPGGARLVADSAFFGWLCNLVLPARLGEIARPAMYSRNADVPFARVLATSVVERTADLAVVSLGLWFALLVLPMPAGLPGGLRSAARAMLVVAPLLLATLVLASRRGGGSPTPGRLRALVSRFQEGLACLRDARAGAVVFAWTVAVWALEALCVWLTFVAFGLEPSISAAVCHVVAVTLSISVVTVPAGLGVEQAVTVAVLGAWGVAASDALAMSLVLSFAAVAWVVPIGLLGAWRQGGTLPSLASAAPTTGPDAPRG